MIITLTQVKSRLGIGDTSQDDYLRGLIEAATSYVVNYCKYYFPNDKVDAHTADLSFALDRITDANTDLSTLFSTGQDLLIISELNDGKFFKISGFTAGAIDVTTPDDLMVTEVDVETTLVVVLFSADVKQAIEDIVIYNYVEPGSSQQVGHDVESEKIGNYSVKYSGKPAGQIYPTSITAVLNSYRRMDFAASDYDGIGSDKDFGTFETETEVQ